METDCYLQNNPNPKVYALPAGNTLVLHWDVWNTDTSPAVLTGATVLFSIACTPQINKTLTSGVAIVPNVNGVANSAIEVTFAISDTQNLTPGFYATELVVETPSVP